MRKVIYGIVGVSMVLVLTGCFGKGSTEEQMYDALEETVNLEKPFVEQQDDIADLEGEERKIFEEVSSLTSDEMDEIQALVKEAIDGIEKREGYIETERESMDASKEEFEKFTSLIEDVEDDGVKEEAEKVVESMKDRYGKYDLLHEIYKETLDLEKDLYALLEDEDAEMTAVTDLLVELNENYEEIMETNGAFNESTSSYNEQKEAFYKATELNISFEEN